jgi:hypothetical protein
MTDPTDIVERLEEWATLLRGDPSFDAIDEIVKLREDRDRLRQTANGLAGCVTIRNAHVEDRDAEIVRLREANGELTLHLNDTRQKLQPGEWELLMADWASDE